MSMALKDSKDTHTELHCLFFFAIYFSPTSSLTNSGCEAEDYLLSTRSC